jgi:hypothetical protein
LGSIEIDCRGLMLRWFYGPAVTKTNRIWHELNPMPKRASVDQRIEWHREHARQCGCRPIPPGLQTEIMLRTQSRQNDKKVTEDGESEV